MNRNYSGFSLGSPKPLRRHMFSTGYAISNFGRIILNIHSLTLEIGLWIRTVHLQRAHRATRSVILTCICKCVNVCANVIKIGGRIGVSSTPGQGSTFRFYLRCRRAIALNQVIDANADNLKKMVLEAETTGSQASLAVKTLKDPRYINVLNHSHTSLSNPVIGSTSNSDTLHVLIVEDNLINQKVCGHQTIRM
jgi:hypothetical protein